MRIWERQSQLGSGAEHIQLPALCLLFNPYPKTSQPPLHIPAAPPQPVGILGILDSTHPAQTQLKPTARAAILPQNTHSALLGSGKSQNPTHHRVQSRC